MSVESVTDFLRQAKKVLKRVDREDVVLSRRGKEPILISLESRASAKAAKAQASYAAMENASRVLASALASVVEKAGLTDVLAREYPWMRFLPPDAREQFTREFFDSVTAGASVGNLSELDAILHAWKSTAQIYADPELAADLKRPAEGTKRVVKRPAARR